MSIDLLFILLPVVLLLVLLLFQVPVAISLGASGVVGILLQGDFGKTTSTLAAIPYSNTAVFTLTLIPMFILMGLLVSHAGLLTGIFDVAERLTRRLPGGLAVATVGACTFFGGISGSSVADAATIGRLSIGEMSRRRYDVAYSAAVVAASGTLAILIPPSIVLVLYGILTGESIGAMLLAGLIPGFLTALVYVVIVVIQALRHEDRGGAAFRDRKLLDGASIRPLSDLRTRIFGVVTGLVLFAVVVGGLYSGVFTATEAGGVGALTALILTILFFVTGRQPGRFSAGANAISQSLREAGSLTAMVFALLIGGGLFSYFLVLARVPNNVSAFIVESGVPPVLVVILLLLVLLPLGMIIDGLSMLLIITPIAYPIVTELGYDGIWFGILLVKMIEIGLLTPPVGLNVFVVSGLHPELRVEKVFRRVAIFVVAELAIVALLFIFPTIITFLPTLAAGNQ
jgi:C4-dicarboxylate transporter DctM subunit